MASRSDVDDDFPSLSPPHSVDAECVPEDPAAMATSVPHTPSAHGSHSAATGASAAHSTAHAQADGEAASCSSDPSPPAEDVEAAAAAGGAAGVGGCEVNDVAAGGDGDGGSEERQCAEGSDRFPTYRINDVVSGATTEVPHGNDRRSGAGSGSGAAAAAASAAASACAAAASAAAPPGAARDEQDGVGANLLNNLRDGHGQDGGARGRHGAEDANNVPVRPSADDGPDDGPGDGDGPGGDGRQDARRHDAGPAHDGVGGVRPDGDGDGDGDGAVVISDGDSKKAARSRLIITGMLAAGAFGLVLYHNRETLLNLLETAKKLTGLTKRVEVVEATVGDQGEALSATRRDLAVQTARLSTVEETVKIIMAENRQLKSDNAKLKSTVAANTKEIGYQRHAFAQEKARTDVIVGDLRHELAQAKELAKEAMLESGKATSTAQKSKAMAEGNRAAVGQLASRVEYSTLAGYGSAVTVVLALGAMYMSKK